MPSIAITASKANNVLNLAKERGFELSTMGSWRLLMRGGRALIIVWPLHSEGDADFQELVYQFEVSDDVEALLKKAAE